MKQISKRVISFVLAFVMVVGLLPISRTSVANAEGKEVSTKSEGRKATEEWLKKHTPINGGYYRVWSDEANPDAKKYKNAQTRMGDIPKEVDLVLAFYDNEMARVPEKVMKKYVDELHKKGQKVVGSIFAHILYKDIEYHLNLHDEISEKYSKYLKSKDNSDRKVLEFPNTDEGNRDRAEFILHYYMNKYNFDGLDIDMEKKENEFNKYKEHYNKVLELLSKMVGPKSNTDKLLIYDTTYSAFHPAFESHKDKFDLVLIQLYGGRSEYKNTEEYIKSEEFKNNEDYEQNRHMTLFDTFKSLVGSEKIMIGFSYYEENSHTTKILPSPLYDNNRWYDIPMSDGTVEKNINDGKTEIVQGKFTDSRASRYARWQPKDSLKAGVFSYAIERDGVPHPTKEDAKKAYEEYSKFKDGYDIKIEEWVKKERPGKSDSDDLAPTDYEYSKELKEILNENNAYDIIDEKDFPDEHLRKQVISQIGEYKGMIPRYNKELILDDSEIKDLTGLEKLVNLNKLTLKDLNKVEKLSPENLPEGIRKERSHTEYKKSDSKLVLENLSGLKELSLKGLHLEDLEIIKPENFKSLEKLDISDNNLDLSPGSNNRKVFDALVKNINNKENVKFEGQEPFWYYPETFSPSFVRLEVGKEYDVRKEVLKGQVTSQGYYVTPDKFNEYTSRKIDGKPFLKDGYNVKLLDYSKFTIETTNSTLDPVEKNIVKTYTDETFISTIKNGEEKEVHKLKIVVGEEKPISSKIEIDKNKIYNSTAKYEYENEMALRAFDGDEENGFATFSQPSKGTPVYIAFEVEDGTSLNLWKLFQSSNSSRSYNNDSNVIAELQYLSDSNFKLDDKKSLEEKIKELNEQNWVSVDEIKDASGKVYKNKFNPQSHKYWRINVKSTLKAGSMVQIPEVKLYGTKLDKSPLENAIKDAKEYLENKKGNQRPYAQEGLDKLREVVEDAERALKTEKLTKELINSNANKISQAIATLTLDNTEKQTEENITKENLNKKLANLVEKAKKLDVSKLSGSIKNNLDSALYNAELLRTNDESTVKDLTKSADGLEKAVNDASKEIEEQNKTRSKEEKPADSKKVNNKTKKQSTSKKIITFFKNINKKIGNFVKGFIKGVISTINGLF
ncbi:EndoS/ChiA family endoglycosidase [Helcococcus ovis]|uniref:EndoS/ChiA family endoglycosidase n=1 Tax=Helcococcus ovis TaxID=72026 RepID=UPI0038BE1527